MFDISGPDFLVLLVAALFILGPERLPGAARWLGQTVRKVREYATGARDHLVAEVGDDFDELRKPLRDLTRLRTIDPRRALAQHLFDTPDDDPRADLRDIVTSPPQPAAAGPVDLRSPASVAQIPVPVGQRPPFDPDAT